MCDKVSIKTCTNVSGNIHLSRVVQENVGVHEGLDGDLDHAQPRHLLKRFKVEKEKSNLQI